MHIEEERTERMATLAQTNDYTAKDIEILEGLEPVRKRPGMYIGSTDIRGLHQLVTEVVDNSIDEAMAGGCDHDSDHDQCATARSPVEDNGRGIPVEPHPKRPKHSTLEIVMTTLHAGGKFGGDGYKQGSSGLHGVGVSAVNALSEYCRVEVKRGGKLHMQEYRYGKPLAPVQVVGTAEGTGTRTTFLPDLTIMETGDFQFDTLAQRFREMAYLNRGLTIKISRRARGPGAGADVLLRRRPQVVRAPSEQEPQRRHGSADAYREAASTRRWSRSRCSTTTAIARRSSLSPMASIPSMAARM